MISFKQFLLEGKETLPLNDASLRIIKQNCSKFLNEGIHTPLYRGGTGSPQMTIKYYPQPTNRKPLDSPELLQNVYNMCFEKAFGIKNLRSTSYFVTFRIGSAIAYSKEDPKKARIVFPSGDYKFAHSNTFDDLLDHARNIANNVVDEYLSQYISELENLEYSDAERYTIIKAALSDKGKFLGLEKTEKFEHFKQYADKLNISTEVFIQRLEDLFANEYKMAYEIDDKFGNFLGSVSEFNVFEGNGFYMFYSSDIVDFMISQKPELKETGFTKIYESFLNYIKNL